MDLQEQYDKLLRYCYMKTKDKYLAEDIVQETFLRFWQNHTYKDTGKEQAYLYMIARNLCMDEFRRHREENIFDMQEVSAKKDTEPEENLNRIMIEQALEQLPEDLREIVVLRYTNDLSVSDVAKIMNMSRFQVHRRVKEGLNKMKIYMREGE